MRLLLILGIIGAIYYWLSKTPSPIEIIKATRYDLESGEVYWNGKKIYAEWGGEKTRSGDLRYFGRAYDENVPFMTHDTVLTTGEFSDAEKVFVSPIESGNMYWKPIVKSPEGTLIVLHLFPDSISVASELSKLKEGDKVEFVGRDEEDSSIDDERGMIIGLRHDNHRFFLVEEVNKLN